MEDALKLNFLKGDATPLFIVELQVFQVIQVQCLRLGVLLEAKSRLTVVSHEAKKEQNESTQNKNTRTLL